MIEDNIKEIALFITLQKIGQIHPIMQMILIRAKIHLKIIFRSISKFLNLKIEKKNNGRKIKIYRRT